jgi:hypothetical protein
MNYGRSLPQIKPLAENEAGREALSASESSDDVQQQRQHHANHDGCSQGKIHRRMLPAKDNVARKPTEGDVASSQQDGHDACNDENSAGKN